MSVNVNKSFLGQSDFLGRLAIGEYNVIGFQEPGFDFQHQTRSTREWSVVYPKGHDPMQKKVTQSLIMVNIALDSTSWKQLPVESVDVVAIEIAGVFGKLRIFSVY
ncbi:hypothetical protein FIBSPDRAFT_747554, partial [Athelia psychrophila]